MPVLSKILKRVIARKLREHLHWYDILPQIYKILQNIWIDGYGEEYSKNNKDSFSTWNTSSMILISFFHRIKLEETIPKEVSLTYYFSVIYGRPNPGDPLTWTTVIDYRLPWIYICASVLDTHNNNIFILRSPILILV